MSEPPLVNKDGASFELFLNEEDAVVDWIMQWLKAGSNSLDVIWLIVDLEKSLYRWFVPFLTARPASGYCDDAR